MQRSRALILPVLVLLVLAACGGPAASGDDGNGDGSSDGAQASASTASEPSEEASAEASSDGNGHAAGDLDSLIEALTPPNSSEISRTTAEGGAFVAWESTDSVDSLKSYYENAIPDAGMHIFSTTNASGTYAWVFAESEGSSFGGSVTIGPSSTGGDGASVIVTATTG